MRYLYILYAIDAWECTEEEIETKYRVELAEHPDWKDPSMEKFIEGERNLGTDTGVTMEKMAVGYFTKKPDALRKAKMNFLDYNESGCFPYGAVVKLPVDCGYPLPEEFWIFRYDRKTDRYYEIGRQENRVTRAIARDLSGLMCQRVDEEYPVC